MAWADFFLAQQKKREESHRNRSIKKFEKADGAILSYDTKTLINFSSNNYLGLSTHPHVIQKSQLFLKTYGAGAMASRIVCGSWPYHQETEQKLAKSIGKEDALLFCSGFQANLTVLPALADRQTLILSDRYNHNSLLQGAKLSHAKCLRYNHNDLQHLKRLLTQYTTSFQRVLIVSESFFGMDGDQADLDGLSQLAKEFKALLYVDDSHAFGVLGPNGMGLAANREDVDIVMGAFGKAAGCFGGFIAGSHILKQHLVNQCSGVMFSTALPPAMVGAIAGALDMIPNLNKEREVIQNLSLFLRNEIRKLGYDVGIAKNHVIPVLIGEDEKACSLSTFLETQGILALPIRPPTVPEGTARLRLSLSSAHTTFHIEKLLEALCVWKTLKN
ncbi:putative 8-amino-7-oxononanoate synthase/2-amino-3-ketobutyrate coenzyme A ligase [Parachlamydia acanthamoebae UV-7]|uniref:Putative 8-amino-7-oxononanoate synthase/2-amino-3-ketobutyrate coenzyme A ligase n=1 Tax=Parachlamydia acanthamoebae (strain UV7) TaxID=765952 RepID=F8KZG1_PARAV|nr:8-amino-7-oxononanoate synthase [Parachlamydia acanthamoebae]EFB41812.1 hypothetical protein pah_c022o104 [Parachlamydia acanthamoebae str. Hall's coccus]CCB86301.1 putative 8-amino-7-oxononanoate synthase/2-amino-3-ketobutyrate coenzyme A ligase [Parachlamydia acanthamoebae UV-7]